MGTSTPRKMSLNDASYLSSIKGAQAFIRMDPNLLRFPEVVLERIHIKIEEDLSPSSSTHAPTGEERELERAEEKEEEWPNKSQEMQNGEGSYYINGASAESPSREHKSSKKEHRKDMAKAGHRFGFNGSMSEVERGGGHRRGGKRRRGGWHHFAIRDRQQFQRKRKKHTMSYVEEERQRGQRFSEEENEALVVNVLRYYRELCGHSAIKGSATRKRRLWQDVVDKVNSVATTYRTIEVCKKRYGDCRRAVRLKMAALEQQAQGRGDPNEQIRFNSWEEKLRQKISSLMSAGGQPNTMEITSPNVQETLSSILCSSWTPTVDTAASSIVQSAASGEAFSEGEEATSTLDVQIVQVHSERIPEGPEPPQEPIVPHQENSGHHVTGPEPTYQQLQEECNNNLRPPSQSQPTELHKLRENVVEGNRRMVQHLEGLTSEVRELNAHIRQIHMNQAHFNLMFQNYLSDTKQFYGAMIQAMRNLQQSPAVTPLASPAASPVPSPQPVPTLPNALLLPAMSDYTTVSPGGSAEAASTASEVPVYGSSYANRRSASAFQPPKKY